jgi:hypothetical protein
LLAKRSSAPANKASQIDHGKVELTWIWRLYIGDRGPKPLVGVRLKAVVQPEHAPIDTTRQPVDERYIDTERMAQDR